jgi:hypothetical protein
MRGAAGQDDPSLSPPGHDHRGRSDNGDEQTQERDPNHFTSTALAQRHRHRAPTIARVWASPAVSGEAVRGAL